MAVLIDVNFTSAAKLDGLQKAARAHGIEFSVYSVVRGEEIARAIDGAQASGATALNIVSSPLFYAYRHLIMERAAADCLRSMNFPSRRRKVALPPMDRAVVSSMQKYCPSRSSKSSAAPRWPTSRSNNRPSSSW
jgi:hypothetical protein